MCIRDRYQGYMGKITTDMYDIVKIDNYSKYDWYKNLDKRYAQRLSLRPKNLRKRPARGRGNQMVVLEIAALFL